jgi:hypothetical protein
VCSKNGLVSEIAWYYLLVTIDYSINNSYKNMKLYIGTVQRTDTNKDPLIYAATSPNTYVFLLAILTTATLASTNNVLPDNGVTAPKHVGGVLVVILM